MLQTAVVGGWDRRIVEAFVVFM